MRMTETPPAKLRLSSPGDLVEAVPYLLGFHPQDSVVALALRGSHRRVVFTMRLDLTGGADDRLADGIAACLARAKAEHAVLLTYGAPRAAAGALPHADVVHSVSRALAARRIDLAEALHVGGDRWWSHTCADPVCCPPEGTLLVAESCSTVAATATFAGLVALPSRTALEQTLEPVGFLAAAGMRQALIRAGGAIAAHSVQEPGVLSVRAESIELLTAAVDAGGSLSDDEAARLIVGLRDAAVRDICCEWSTTVRAVPARRLWTELVRRAVPPWATVPLFLTAWSAYLAGDATLAAIAVERCLRGEPTYRLAVLLQEALQRVVDPALFRQVSLSADRSPPAEPRI